MANDYRRWYRSNDFLLNIRKNNMYSRYDSFYEKGYTGYEKYYIDFEMNASQGVVAYWRELYNPDDNVKGVINTIKLLAIDMIDVASYGYPGIVLGAAPIMYTLFAHHLRFDTSKKPNINFFLEDNHDKASIKQ